MAQQGDYPGERGPGYAQAAGFGAALPGAVIRPAVCTPGPPSLDGGS
jgi:hypothetical protein